MNLSLNKLGLQLRVIGRFAVYLIQEYSRDKALLSASALTLSTLAALVPLGVISLSVLATIPAFEGVAQQVQNFIFQNFVPAASETIQYHLSRFVEKASGLRFVGISLFVLTSLLLIRLVDSALNEIWGVKTRRRGARAFLIYWTLLTLGPIFFGLSFGLTSYFGSLLAVPDIFRDSGLSELLYTAIPFALTVAILTFTYLFVPKRRVRFSHAFSSALVAAVLFEFAKQGFAFYVTHIPAHEIVYGALAALPLFLFWLYLSWSIVLLGAEMARCLQTFQRCENDQPISRFVLGLILLHQLWRAHQRGITCDQYAISKEFPSIPEAEIREVLNTLRSVNLIGQTENGNYVLKRDLGQLTLMQFYQLTPWRLPEGSGTGLPRPAFLRENLRSLIGRMETSLNAVLGISVESIFRSDHRSGKEESADEGSKDDPDSTGNE